jgi:hypothetical protein
MADNLYRREITSRPHGGSCIQALRARRGLVHMKDTINGRSSLSRDPAWAWISGKANACFGGQGMTLPSLDNTWNDTYDTFKPGPDLESVVVEYGGDWGLARKVSATIKCYTKDQFERVRVAYLIPGNEVSVRFGYENPWGAHQPEEISLSGFKVAVFSFNTTDEGFWICNFTAVAMSEALKNLDMQLVVCNGCDPFGGKGQEGGGGPIKFIDGDGEKHPVKGIAQLITSDAQVNGTVSLDHMPDGYVQETFMNYAPGAVSDASAAMVIYTGDHLRDRAGKFMAWATGILKDLGFSQRDEVESTNNQVYVSLAYVVNRLINDQLLRAFSCEVIDKDRGQFNDMKVDFDPVYSKARIPAGMISGDPTSVLLLGSGAGNYKNYKGEGKDFEGDCKSLGAVTALDGIGNVRLQNILIHRDVVAAAFNSATKKREAQADNADVKDTKEDVVNVVDFFAGIADHISAALGGALSLRLVVHPDRHDRLIVVDQTYGVTSKLTCWVFDPIRGDGSTRSCTIQSNVGSQEYRAAMFIGNSKKGDAVAAIRGCEKELPKKRSEEILQARLDKVAIVKAPGTMGSNHFDSTEADALKAVMSRIYRNNTRAGTDETIHFPGLSISIEIDGVFGFEPGCAISTTQLPQGWFASHAYFMVTKVTHKIAQSDWSTVIDGILAYYPNVSFIPSTG